jgi:very-short-patch-repair endonuclease
MEEVFREMASELMVKVSRDLRKTQTDAEAILWEYLQNRQLNGIKFRRQHPIASTNYVADFFCYEVKLVIELDGSIHDQQQTQDAVRQRDIEALGYYVLRFKNVAVFNDLESVLAEVLSLYAALKSSR